MVSTLPCILYGLCIEATAYLSLLARSKPGLLGEAYTAPLCLVTSVFG
jgi:hypothetical protein